MWVLRGLRNGVLTTRWPARPDPYAAAGSGPGAVWDARPAGGEQFSSLWLTGATSHSAGRVRLDQGRCVQCGRCVAARPDVFGWARGPEAAALSRGSLIVPEMTATPERLAALRDGVRAPAAGAAR